MQKRGRPKLADDRPLEAHIYLEPSLMNALKDRAREADRSLTAEIRRGLRFYLENIEAA
jgi:hypothetical protein